MGNKFCDPKLHDLPDGGEVIARWFVSIEDATTPGGRRYWACCDEHLPYAMRRLGAEAAGGIDVTVRGLPVEHDECRVCGGSVSDHGPVEQQRCGEVVSRG